MRGEYGTKPRLLPGEHIPAAIIGAASRRGILTGRSRALEMRSEHPLARALVGWAEHERWQLDAPHSVEVLKGMGISGQVAGHTVWVGNRHLLDRVPRSPGKAGARLGATGPHRGVLWLRR
jgi:cation transport ATPase